MKSTHSLAENLLVRLQAYSQRKHRDPIEDFCTEALAWCLLNSHEFRKRFLALIDSSLELDFTVHTQLSFSGEEEENGGESEPHGESGRFDLLIESKNPLSWLMAIECKIWSPLGDGQLEKYRRELESRSAIRNRQLVTLTPKANIVAPSFSSGIRVTHLTWAAVCGALEAEAPSNPQQMVFKWFAELLKQKGVVLMSLKPMPPVLKASLATLVQNLGAFEGILRALKPAHEDVRSPKWDHDTRKQRSWFGRYADSGEWGLYYGFGFLYSVELAEVVLITEIWVKGGAVDMDKGFPTELKQRNQAATKYMGNTRETVEGKTWFHFVEPLSGEYDGNTDRVKMWFSETISMTKEAAKSWTTRPEAASQVS